MIFFTVFLAVLGFFAACFFVRWIHIVIPVTLVLLAICFVFWLIGSNHEHQENLKQVPTNYSSRIGLSPEATPSVPATQSFAETK